jgi:predicted transcriptional regulator
MELFASMSFVFCLILGTLLCATKTVQAKLEQRKRAVRYAQRPPLADYVALSDVGEIERNEMQWHLDFLKRHRAVRKSNDSKDKKEFHNDLERVEDELMDFIRTGSSVGRASG